MTSCARSCSSCILETHTGNYPLVVTVAGMASNGPTVSVGE
jgi:hypothetical protein